MEAHANNREAHEHGLPFYRKPINMGFPTKGYNRKPMISIEIELFKKKIHLNRASGFYNALIGKPSWYRPKIDN